MTNSADRQNRRIIRIMILMSLMFLSIIVYLSYFELFMKYKIIGSAYNRRNLEQEDNAIRGGIYDRHGLQIAVSEPKDNRMVRIYPFGALYSQVVGYNSRIYGRSLLEAKYNNYLLNINGFNDAFRFTGEKNVGNDLVLTIDHNLQVLGDQLMGNRNGALVAMDPKTGEILAMVSKPDFDPNEDKLAEMWTELAESKEHYFLPRATQGLYAPGSTFKVVTSSAALEDGLGDMTVEDNGYVVIDGKSFSNFGGHSYGMLDIKTALAVSSNVFFCQLGVNIGEKAMKDTAIRFGFENDIQFDIPLSQSRFPYKAMGKTDLASAAIGQGKVLVTPLHMAMIASCIANNGVMMKPFLVKDVVSPQGVVLMSRKPEVYDQVLSPDVAGAVKFMMREVVESGTGTNAAIYGVSVAGKTGTAENEMKGKEHAWFIGFAPVEDPIIAVSVVLEYSGSTGGASAAPIARDVMASWIARQ